MNALPLGAGSFSGIAQPRCLIQFLIQWQAKTANLVDPRCLEC